MIQQSAGFREIEHTADWQLEAWAPDLPGLFEQAARGMYSLAGVHLKAAPRCMRSFELKAEDVETLLVRFLSELLYFEEQEGLGFDGFDLALRDNSLAVNLSGAPLATRSKEIKAVTYHNLLVQTSPQGLDVNIVFDV
jgi:SHS2 domain-containing protein